MELQIVEGAAVVQAVAYQDKMEKNKIIVIIGVAVIAIFALFFVKGLITGNAAALVGDYQKVVIDMKSWAYNPSTIKVAKDVPVRLYLSDNVQGCFRDLTLPEMGINKYLRTSNDYIEVTFPEGTYTFACSMYMGQGKIISS